MKPRTDRGAGWVAYSAIVLTLAGIFGIIDGLVAVYKSSFFTANAVFVFSDLKTWGWITFGVGAASLVSGLAVIGGSQWARWIGVTVAGLAAIGQLLFAQAYPLWSLMIMTLDVLVVYGLVVHGGRATEALASRRQEPAVPESAVSQLNDRERVDRAA